MDIRNQLVNDILAIIPDANPAWLLEQVSLHLAAGPGVLDARAYILDSAFMYGYVKASNNPGPLGAPPPPPPALAAAAPLPPPAPAPVRALAPHPGVRPAQKRKALESVAASPTKKQALPSRVDYTKTQRPPSHTRDLCIRRQFSEYAYLVPTYLALQHKVTNHTLGCNMLKKRRFCTAPFGNECDQSPLFAAEKKALDTYIKSGCADVDLLRQGSPPLEDAAPPHGELVAPMSASSSRSNTPMAGPSQPIRPSASQSNSMSQASTVKQQASASQGGRMAGTQRSETRSPTPIGCSLRSRSPTPIEIETHDSVIVIESQESDVVVLESQEGGIEMMRSPLPLAAVESTDVECGCCFTEIEISEMLQCADGHLFCGECTKKNAETAVGDGKPDVLCMDQSGCRMPFTDDQLQRVLSPKTLDLLLRIRQKKDLEEAKLGGLEHCPFCDFACIIVDDGPTFLCQKPGCLVVSCRKCWKKEHMGKTCEEVVREEKDLQGEHMIAEAMTMALIRDCPKCKTPFMKEAGCNKMICPKCGTISCYICRKEVSRLSPYIHFDQQPDAYHLPPDRRKCPLWDVDRSGRAGGSPTRAHSEAVARAEREARAKLATQQKLKAPQFR
ncbi:Pectinesterase [Ceratobasidium theobromae]|uniref:Pectinesterase n=1 Tax=Ceratobasidium theobromae TaxID=1582974 RepID=A0A5N5QXD5_9AGAM|nr:Pectinesterase [Ceratobasidium theobromae]